MATLQDSAKISAGENYASLQTSSSRAVEEILFLDTGVTDYSLLAAGVKTGVEVILIHSYQDGVQQITKVLKERKNIQTAYIVAHGSPGCLHLGSSKLNINTLSYYADQLQYWSVSNLLLYSCYVGANPIFLQELKQLTGANIAATRTIIGNSELERNWNLEVTTGKINVSSVFEVEVMVRYSSVLGAELVKDIISSNDYSSQYYDFTVADSTIFFEINGYPDSTFKSQLWKSDGTEAGTTLVKDFLGNDPYNYIAVGNTVYFKIQSYDSATGDISTQLWKSDGTIGNTTLVKEFINSFYYALNNFKVVNNTLYFTAYDTKNSHTLWKVNETGTDTIIVKNQWNSSPNNLININGTLYFTADDNIHGTELWKTDGTETGTVLVKDIYPVIIADIGSVNPGSFPSSLTNVNDKLYFLADDGTPGNEWWTTDGTEDGTVLVKDIVEGNFSPSIDDVNVAENKLFFEVQAHDSIYKNRLWKSDGTEGGTILVKDFLDKNPFNYIAIGNTIYFQINSYNYATGTINQLWKSDGTEGGTTLVKEFANLNSYEFGNFTVVDNTLYFIANDGTHGTELWKTNGTPDGTVMVKDINASDQWSSSSPKNLTNVNGILYFTANDGIHQIELWKTDGTETGTVMVEDIHPEDSDPSNLIAINDTLYLTAHDGIHGKELWKATNTNDIDTTPPIAISFIPTDNSSNITTDSNFVITFSEPIVKGLGNILIKKLSDNSTVETIDVTSQNVTIINNQVTIDPTLKLEGGQQYYIQMPSGIFKDNTGNNYAGINNTTNWNFETTRTGTEANDTLNGTGANDTLSGAGGNDLLIGYSGNDLLNGGTGTDQLKGGTENDTYVVDNAGDLVTELTNQGTDLVESSITYTLPTEVENLTLTGTATINGTGNSLANTITGNTANNILNGSTGTDTSKGGAGNDTYVVDNAGDVVTELANQGTDLIESSITYTLPTGVENLTLTGTATINGTGNSLNNTLVGNSANNNLDGSTGADTSKGGAGNDTYIVDNTGDIVTELVNQGIDGVKSNITYTLPVEVENLTLTGTAAINGTGNSLNNTIVGNTANNTLNGLGGNDTYGVDHTGDVVTELANQGTDLVESSITYTLPAEVENLTLTGTAAINGTGNSLTNTLVGNTANNIINGSTGADTSKGGTGNDTYIVDNAGDVVTELANQGTDLVESNITYTLPAEVENLTLTGTAAINGTGNSLNNTLIGNTANNIINGSTGADTSKGGAGNDTYAIDNAGDIVTELASEGTDLVRASVTYTLPAEVENLVLVGTAAINGTGNSLNNTIIGNTANNILKGDGGNDTYGVDHTGDVVTELANQGVDGIKSSVTYTLPSEVENLVLTGTAAINGTGNSLANVLIGNTANNILKGNEGADRLDGQDGSDSINGGVGNDALTGGLGADKFVYESNAAFTTTDLGLDTITDFALAQTDQIILDKTTFSAISSIVGTGFSVSSEFATVTTDALAATSAADIVYNTATGGLFYNPNGTTAGFGAGSQFLILTGKPALTSSQFLIQS